VLDESIFQKLDIDNDAINFTNGIYNMSTYKFRSRTPKDFFTKTLDYPYSKKRNEKKIKYINDLIFKICNNDTQQTLDCLNWLAYSMTASKKHQMMFFFIGYLASNGKSMLKQMFCNMYSIYSDTLSSETFKQSVTNGHKFMADISGLRSYFIEELDKSKQNTNQLKSVVSDKSMRIQKLYSTTSKLLLIGKLTIISNYSPNLDVDNGILRRARSMMFNNKFLNNEEWAKFDKAKKLDASCYHANIKLDDIIERSDFKLSFFHLMEEHLKLYNKNGINDFSKYAKNFQKIADENDYVANFVKNYYEIGNMNDATYRVSKNDFYELYKDVNQCKILWNSLLSDIKRIDGIKYHGTYSINNVKGVLCGIKLKDQSAKSSDKNRHDITEKDINEDSDIEDVPIIKKSDKLVIVENKVVEKNTIVKKDVDEMQKLYDQGCEKIKNDNKVEFDTVVVESDDSDQEDDPYVKTL
jgi:phage/plasmid-associated DNA primase